MRASRRLLRSLLSMRTLVTLVDLARTPRPNSGSWHRILSPARPKTELEEGAILTPRFDQHGLVTAVVTDHASGEVLMLAHMNAEAISRSIGRAMPGTGRVRARRSGARARRAAIRRRSSRCASIATDAIWIRVEQTGPACHTERKSCFYRKVERAPEGARLVIAPLGG